MPRGDNARKGSKGFQRTAPTPVRPTPVETYVRGLVDSPKDTEATSDVSAIRDTYSAYEELRNPEPVRESTDSGKQNRCELCGKYVSAASSSHECIEKMSKGKQAIFMAAPAVAAAGTFGTVALITALGTPALIVAGGFIAGGIGIRSFMRRRAFQFIKSKIANPAYKYAGEVWKDKAEKLQDEVNELKGPMGVPGEVALLVQEKLQSPAAAVRVDKENAAILVSPKFLRLDPQEARTIIAHELAHLQPVERYKRVKVFASKAAYPAAVGVAAASGLAALPAAAVAAFVWYGGKMVSSAASRKEEQRADKEAYKAFGEQYAEALTNLEKEHKTVRHDMPWRAEDVIFSHPNLPNRLQDMRESVSS